MMIEPQDIADGEPIFPARVDDLIPAWNEIPSGFKSRDNVWVRLQEAWPANGATSKGQCDARPGIDAPRACRHLNAIQRSTGLIPEYKAAAVAYLASLWFRRVTLNGECFEDGE
ncbi:MAG TPA: hypothetical protein VF265_09740 [Nevskiaceae bacterium]